MPRVVPVPSREHPLQTARLSSNVFRARHDVLGEAVLPTIRLEQLRPEQLHRTAGHRTGQAPQTLHGPTSERPPREKRAAPLEALDRCPRNCDREPRPALRT